MPRPALENAPEWYHRYINQVEEDEILLALENQTTLTNSFFEKVPIDKREFRYAEGKWSIKDIIQHIIDTERIFAYRVLRFARNDETVLPGYDENNYADNAKADTRSWDDLLEEFNAVRLTTKILFKSLNDEQLNLVGIASGNPISVHSLGFIIAGHANHHINVIKEKYL